MIKIDTKIFLKKSKKENRKTKIDKKCIYTNHTLVESR